MKARKRFFGATRAGTEARRAEEKLAAGLGFTPDECKAIKDQLKAEVIKSGESVWTRGGVSYVCVRCRKVHRNSRDTCTSCAGPVRTDYWDRPRLAAEGDSFWTLFPACRGERQRGAK